MKLSSLSSLVAVAILGNFAAGCGGGGGGSQSSSTTPVTPITKTPTGYTLTDLGAFQAVSINNTGQVAGTANSASGTSHAFLYDSSGLHDLGALGSNTSGAFSVNNAGQVAGYYDDSSLHAPHAVVLSATASAITLPGFGGQGLSINDSGQVAGLYEYTTTSDTQHAAIWTNGVLKDLTPTNTNGSFAYAINSNGAATGADYDTNTAFIYDSNGLRPLNGMATGYAINKSEQVAGTTQNNHAALYNGTSVLDLGTLGGTQSRANGINDSGQVVGDADVTGGTGQHAFLYSGGKMTDLNSFVSTTGLVLNRANSVSNTGYITGSGTIGGQSHAFLLTPTFN